MQDKETLDSRTKGFGIIVAALPGGVGPKKPPHAPVQRRLTDFRDAESAQRSSCTGLGSVEFKILRISRGFNPL
jgi:hypothetical protein